MTLPRTLTAVQMEAASGCGRCERQIPVLAFAFLDENYATVCANCAASFYNLLHAVNDGLDLGPGDTPDE